LSAVRADYVVHLTRAATAGTHVGVAIVVAFTPALGSTPWTPYRIHEPALAKKLLLSGREYELGTAIATFDDLVFPDHVSPDFLTSSGAPSSMPHPPAESTVRRRGLFGIPQSAIRHQSCGNTGYCLLSMQTV
jgi:hypothetical protein